MKILILNGPNLNLLGKREESIYGNTSFDDFFLELKEKHTSLELEYFQSNSEGIIIDKLHISDNLFDGIIINAGAYTHTSIAIADAIRGISTPVVEVHISNIHSREEFRHHSYLSPHCKGVILGFGLDSYKLALEYYMHKTQ